ncbi:class I SAM-dependent methyltransferase [Rhizobium sp. 32-5/1]|uniref:class I SAM-dependent methyltransferase n=1 Tax=Rhizobium sp. 32-5/1 TaxID=3019602 RepID=UPI00240E140C|nr:class I SAM-dependent methyltransferase [Rhizobium sp. 32-5/1]WEZ83846.1 class I SAM-dependent methyltransferase [Rhizobium sp. 32-5/1]
MVSSSDDATLNFYALRAEAYAAKTADTPADGLDGFLDALQAGALILELGCGSGRDSAHMLSRGFDVAPTDGSPEMAALAEQRLGRPVAILPFDQLTAVNLYDGIWANACLLHVPRPALSGILTRIRPALKAGGLFRASLKAGDLEGRDRFDRYYNYPSECWLRDCYEAAGWTTIRIETRDGGGYDGEPTLWLRVHAVA